MPQLVHCVSSTFTIRSESRYPSAVLVVYQPSRKYLWRLNHSWPNWEWCIRHGKCLRDPGMMQCVDFNRWSWILVRFKPFSIRNMVKWTWVNRINSWKQTKSKRIKSIRLESFCRLMFVLRSFRLCHHVVKVSSSTIRLYWQSPVLRKSHPNFARWIIYRECLLFQLINCMMCTLMNWERIGICARLI